LSANRCSFERFLRLRVVAFASLVPFLMRLPLDRVAGWLATTRGATTQLSSEEVARLVGRIDSWLEGSRPMVRSGCVTRGVTLLRFLRRAGADVSLHFGVGTVDGAIAAHCWIVYRGEPLVERRDPRPIFTETWAIAP
jgi:hypothetical protein